MAVESPAGVGGERGEHDHGGKDDVAQFGLNVVPGVGDALAGVLAECPDNGLADFAGFLGELASGGDFRRLAAIELARGNFPQEILDSMTVLLDRKSVV